MDECTQATDNTKKTFHNISLTGLVMHTCSECNAWNATLATKKQAMGSVKRAIVNLLAQTKRIENEGGLRGKCVRASPDQYYALPCCLHFGGIPFEWTVSLAWGGKITVKHWIYPYTPHSEHFLNPVEKRVEFILDFKRKARISSSAFLLNNVFSQLLHVSD